ncbi:MAG: ATP-dependent helicase HrpB [Caulobacterales bacterium 32-69-10]|nr:MAG: ATP-dependent helicase HrpB [Caulobacterales bacterium 32-69-10]
MTPLPIHDALGPLKAALADHTAAVLVAPPGAGKTTVVPLALMDEPWVQGRRLIVLEPRRLAARAAAARMASTLGEPVGETVGFRVRMQSKVSARTRIEVVTEGVFTRMVLDDPGLDGVAAVLFDEFHERSLDADLGLAFARDAQAVLRDDLRLLVMSATLDGARIARLLDDCPVIRSEGRAWPVETRYLGRDPAARLEDQAVRAVRKALAEETGSVLVFLPGQGEIRRTETALADRLPPDAILAPLYGALDPAEQDRAIDPAPPGRRKVVLATSIAETSLTIEGVRVVVDCGLARVPAYDSASGLTRLETVRVSQAAADQRRGRAGRTQAGVCYRLWDEPETRALPPFARPEILETDLSGFALALAQWGARDPAALAFLDPPPAAAFAEARSLLERLEALDAKGELTAHGRLLSRLPLPPRLAHMVAVGAASGAAGRAARIAAVLTERGLGGTGANLTDRLERFEADRGPRARDARSLADRWARAAGGEGRGQPPSDGILLAAAYPERLAKARGKPGEYRLASGRGVFVEPHEALAKEPWLAVGELGSGAARDRILLAAPLDQAEVEAAFAGRIETEDRLDPDTGGRFKARRIRKLGALILEEKAIDRPDPALIAAALLNQVRREGLITLSFAESTTAFRQRIAFLRQSEADAWPDLSDPALIDTVEDWLAPLLEGKTALSQVFPDALDAAIRALVPWDQQRALDRDAPPRFTAPTGNSFAIDYGAEGGPRVEVRVGELYGLAEHPCLGRARVAITLALLSPAHRPVQTTKDLPGFWRGSWKDVRTEMKGRYPRHVWPEDPAAAAPVTRAKPRGT